MQHIRADDMFQLATLNMESGAGIHINIADMIEMEMCEDDITYLVRIEPEDSRGILRRDQEFRMICVIPHDISALSLLWSEAGIHHDDAVRAADYPVVIVDRLGSVGNRCIVECIGRVGQERLARAAVSPCCMPYRVDFVFWIVRHIPVPVSRPQRQGRERLLS